MVCPFRNSHQLGYKNEQSGSIIARDPTKPKEAVPSSCSSSASRRLIRRGEQRPAALSDSMLSLKIPAISTSKSAHPPSSNRGTLASVSILSSSPTSYSSFFTPGCCRKRRQLASCSNSISRTNCVTNGVVVANMDEQAEVEVVKGYTMTQFCDKMIGFFMHEKPETKDWRKVLVFRDEWKKYRESFFNRCQARVDIETDQAMKQKLLMLARKVKKIDDEIEKHTDLLQEIQENPMDFNAVVARRRKDFTGEFFHHLHVLSDTYDNLEDRDAMARLGAKCLSAVRAYDNALEQLDTLDVAQSKFDEILNSSSLDAACEKIKHLAKAKELDSSLILLINRAWAAAKESTTMKNEVKDIMYHIYKATRKSLRSIAPPEIKLLKHLLNIVDPEERFSALATAFSPGDEHEAKDVDALYTTPKELHKWIKIMLEAYQINKEDSDLIEVRQMTDPMVIQRLFILKETIEEEYLKQDKEREDPEAEE